VTLADPIFFCDLRICILLICDLRPELFADLKIPQVIYILFLLANIPYTAIALTEFVQNKIVLQRRLLGLFRDGFVHYFGEVCWVCNLLINHENLRICDSGMRRNLQICDLRTLKKELLVYLN
jgi:hypothetical protein